MFAERMRVLEFENCGLSIAFLQIYCDKIFFVDVFWKSAFYEMYYMQYQKFKILGYCEM